MTRAGPRSSAPETGGKSGSGESATKKKVRREGSSAASGGQLARNGHLAEGELNLEGELDLVQVLPIKAIRPAPENDAIYRAISFDDPAIIELAKSIKTYGIQAPLLVSRDGYIISGHRRRAAALIAELDLVPVRIHPISYSDDPQGFSRLLVEMNSQRIKSTEVLLHETLIKIDPKEAYQQIKNERKAVERKRARSDLSVIDPDEDGARCVISPAKKPFLDAIKAILDEQEQWWPLSDRQIHYRLLNAPPLIHASKPGSIYGNNRQSYHALTDLLTRGRIDGVIPWKAIDDITRPTDLHRAFWSTSQFLNQIFANFLKGYWRNRQQSQPHHIEIVAEKLTVRSILQSVAQEYTIPLTISRGMSSLPPKKAIVDRYRRSKKDRLILLVVSDLDPAGDAIAEDLVKSFRRDFCLQKIEAYKVALTIEQVEQFDLSPSMDAKDSSPTYAAFVNRYGTTNAYELEALEPAQLAQCLSDAIDSVLDLKLYNQELAAEETDSAQVVAIQQQAAVFFKSFHLDEGAQHGR